MTDVRRVLIFTPDLHYGGVAEVVAKTAFYLARYPELDVHVVVVDDSPVTFHVPPNLKIWRLAIPWIARFGRNQREITLRRIKRLLGLPMVFWRFFKVKRLLEPDIVISHTPVLNFLALLLRKKHEKVFVVDHASPYDDLKDKKIVRGLMICGSKWLYRRATRVIAISRWIERYYLESLHLLKEKVVLIHNPVDLNRVSVLASEEIAPEFKALFEHPVIVTAGRFTRPKGQWHLIRAFKKVKEHIGVAKLLLIGTGELYESLTHLAREAGLSQDIFFLGWQSNPFKYIARSSVFVFPSLWEGFGLAVLEAMACGVPVVASDIPSLRELLSPGTTGRCGRLEYTEYGILCPCPDGIWRSGREPLTPEEEAIAEGIIALLTNEELRKNYAMKSLARARDFSVERVLERWKELLDLKG